MANPEPAPIELPMSDPDVRCPWCGETMPRPAGPSDQPIRCERCGETFIPPTEEPPPAPSVSRPLEIESWFESPETPPLAPPAVELPPPVPAEPRGEPPVSGEVVVLDSPAEPPVVPVARATPPPVSEEVPIVRPAPRPAPVVPPPVASRPPAPPPPVVKGPPRVEPPRPVRPREEEVQRPRPQIGLAIFVLFLMTLCLIGGLTVIVFAIWAGFQTFSRPGRADVPVEVRSVASAPATRSLSES